MPISAADRERAEAAKYPRDDVVRILLEQHARIRELFAAVKVAEGEPKQRAFDELRALLVMHETAEETVLRPVSTKVTGRRVADARNSEEREATHVLAELEKLDVHGAEFANRFKEFELAVVQHAEHEEREEFSALHEARDQEKLERMGRRLRTVESMAPTHPHPSTAGSPLAQSVVGPFASIVDRIRDAVKHNAVKHSAVT